MTDRLVPFDKAFVPDGLRAGGRLEQAVRAASVTVTAIIVPPESALGKAEAAVAPNPVGATQPLALRRSDPGRGALRDVWVLRVAARYLVPVLVAVFVANLVLTQRRSFRNALLALGGAQWGWLPALLAASAATYTMAAVALSAASRHRLLFRHTLAVQVAAAFTNRLAPGGIGGMATNVRYLERCGQQRAEAVSSVSIVWAAGIVVHVLIVIAVGLLFWLGVGDAFQLNLPPAGYWVVVGGLLAVVFALGLVAWRCLRERLVVVAARIRASYADLRQRPGDLRQLLAGSAGMTCSHMFAVVISLQAFGGGVSLLSVAVVYLAATGIAAAIPTPGGVGTLETALAAGLVDVGAASGAAIAAVLTYRLATFWLPIVPGAVTFRSLRHHRIL